MKHFNISLLWVLLLSTTCFSAQVGMQGSIFYPHPVHVLSSRNPTILFETIDSANEKYAIILQAPKAGEIAKVGFRTSTVVTGATVDVRIETVDATTGDPTGTLIDTNCNASQVIADTDDNTWFLTTMTSTCTVTEGQIIAIVIAAPGSGTFDIDISKLDTSANWVRAYFPYESLYTTSWSKDSVSSITALEYNDGSYEWTPGNYPISEASTYSTFNSSATPDEIGIKFKLPFNATINGFWVWIDLNENVTVKLYDSDGSTVLESITLDKDQQVNALNTLKIVRFDGEQALTKDTYYRLTILPDTTTSVTYNYVTVDTASIMDGLIGGQEFHETERTDAGAWTDTTTDRPLMGLMLNKFDDASGGGGGSTETSHTFVY